MEETDEPFYRRSEVSVAKGPLRVDYLEAAYQTIHRAWSYYPSLLGIRCHPRFPEGRADHLCGPDVIERYTASVRAKIKYDREKAARENARVHPCDVRYIWAREYSPENGRPHYHVVWLLNRNAYFTLGNFDSEQDNMYSRLTSGWESALDLPPGTGRGLVDFDMGDLAVLPVKGHGDREGMNRLFFQASYLCKVWSKRFGIGEHPFGHSRI